MNTEVVNSSTENQNIISKKDVMQEDKPIKIKKKLKEALIKEYERLIQNEIIKKECDCIKQTIEKEDGLDKIISENENKNKNQNKRENENKNENKNENENEIKNENENKNEIENKIDILNEIKNIIKNKNKNENENENENKNKNKNKNENACGVYCLICCFIKFILMLACCILNLLSIYQIISIKNALFDEIKEDMKSSVYSEPRGKHFYLRIIDDTFRILPELDIFLVGQILSEYCKEKFGFNLVNITCFSGNSICLGFLIIYYSLINLKIKDLNIHYSTSDYIILILIWFIMYLCTSITSLFIFNKCLDYTKIILRFIFIKKCENSEDDEDEDDDDDDDDDEEVDKNSPEYKEKKFTEGINASKKFNIRFVESLIFVFDASLKALSYYIKIVLNKIIYRNLDYLNNKWLFLFYYFLIYFICGIISILYFMALDYCENNNNNNNNNNEEIELLIKADESSINFFGNISYKYKRIKKTEKKNEYINNKFDINLIEIKNNVKNNIKNTKIINQLEKYKNTLIKLKKTEKIKKNEEMVKKFDDIINQLEKYKNIQTESDKIDKIIKKIKIFESSENQNIQTKIDLNNLIEEYLNKLNEIEKIKEATLNEAINNIIKRKSPFQLVYVKEGICSYLWNFIKKNKLFFFLFLYLFFNIISMNFYNIIEENYLEKKNIEFLSSKHIKYLGSIFLFSILIMFSNLLIITVKYYRLIHIYIYLLGINANLIRFYHINLFKKYYNFKKKKNDMDVKQYELFLTSNLFGFLLQNIYAEKDGNDYLTINGVVAVFDFIYFIIEYLVDLFCGDKCLNNLNYVSYYGSWTVEIIIFFIVIILIINYCIDECKCGCGKFTKYPKCLKKFFQCLTII